MTIHTPTRPSVKDIGYPGAKTKFYREWSTNYPASRMPIPGKNYTEYQLFALRTRVAMDPLYAKFAKKYATNLAYQKQFFNNRMTMFLCVERLPPPDYARETEPKKWPIGLDTVPTGFHGVETLQPDWLQALTDEWSETYPDYSALISDSYPIGHEEKVPNWWLTEVMPLFNIGPLIKKTFFPHNPSFDVTGYDWFYEAGTYYINMISPGNIEDNSGIWSCHVGDLLNTGEQALERGDIVYGDFQDFQRRFHDLQSLVFDTLIDMYQRGVLALEPNNTLISRWQLAELLDSPGLYEPAWKDVRLTSYGGISNLLQRQSDSSSKRWDYNKVYFVIGDDPVARYEFTKWYNLTFSTQPVMMGSLLVANVDSYAMAIQIADQLEILQDTAQGTVTKLKYHPSIPKEEFDGTISYDSLNQTFISTKRIEILDYVDVSLL